MPHHQTVLVIGANGYIGNATALAFSRSGHKTYGLVRKPSFVSQLAADEITPLLGSPSDLSFLPALNDQGVVFDVIVSTTENLTDYISHYNDILSLLRAVAKTSNAAGVRPLVMFTSGCKDYGPSPYVSGDPNLAPHTEKSPLNPPWFLENRCEYALKVFEHGKEDGYDATVLRPTNVYGYGSSFFAGFFLMAEEVKEKGYLEFNERKETVLHAMHIDDCAEGYLALAEHAKRDEVAGQCFNISATKYETLEDIAGALVKEYKIEGGAKWDPALEGPPGKDAPIERYLTGFSQWVGNGKLKTLTGWRDKRMGFAEALGVYRRAFEAKREEDPGLTKKLELRIKKD